MKMIEQWDAALWDKDFNRLIQDYADDFVIYDVMEHAIGPEGYKKLWENCADYFGDHIGVERKDIIIHATENMATASFLTRINGMKEEPEGDMAKSWLRGTVCYQKIDSVWKVIHEHTSFPTDCMNERPKYIMD